MRLLPLTAPPLRATRPATSALEDDERPSGCGWFDSSHELHSGLCVSVHESPDELVRLAPLRWWLQWKLEGVLPPHG